MSENEVIEFLNRLAPADFAQVLTRIPEVGISESGTHAERVSVLVSFVDSKAGPGIKHVELILSELFSDQLRSSDGVYVTPRVFVSYSHDSEEHRERVLNLADRLTNEGIDCHIDRYYETPPPSEGWPEWMLRQVERADFVLVVCTDAYHRRFRRQEEEEKALGVQWEGAVISQELHSSAANNLKFIPIGFVDFTIAKKTIPIVLWGTTYYDVGSEHHYVKLYRQITGQPEVVRPQIGKRRTMIGRQPGNNSGKSTSSSIRPLHTAQASKSSPKWTATDLRRLISGQLSRNEVSILWFNLLGTVMEQELPRYSDPEYVIELLARVSQRGQTRDLIAMLTDLFPRILQKDLDLPKFSFSSDMILRQAVAGLLSRMPFPERVQILHDSKLSGKDILFYMSGAFGESVLCACTVQYSRVDIDARLSDDFNSLLSRISQVFDIPFNFGDGREAFVELLYVISPYELSGSIIEAIKKPLRDQAGRIRFISGAALFDLFKQYWPEYFVDEAALIEYHLSNLSSNLDSETSLSEVALQYQLGNVEQSIRSIYVPQAFHQTIRSFIMVLEI